MIPQETNIYFRSFDSGLEKQRRQYQRDRRKQLDQHVEGWTGCILERITDSITDHRRFVRLGFLAAVRSGLDILLCVIPRTAGVIQEQGHENADDRADHKQPTDDFRTTSCGSGTVDTI